jgi:prolipoprotein diacylglyceryltransferase
MQDMKRGFAKILVAVDGSQPTEVRNTASGFAYHGGLIIGSWSHLVAIHQISIMQCIDSRTPQLI